MATTIKLKYGSGAPSTSNLVQGEPALDLTNKRLYSENGSGAIVEIGSNPSSLSIGGAAVTSTPAELNYNDTGAAVGTVVASKTVTVDSNKDVSSFRNITLTGELDAGSLDISGNVDIDGVLETDALSLNGTTVTSTATQLNVLSGVTAFVDQDNMASNSASSIASQQSIKAYVDAQTGASSGTTATFANLDATTSLQVPDGATGARPGSPAVGNFRYNTTLNTFEGYSNTGWGEIGGGGANLTTNNFTGNGSTTGFTLGIDPEVEQNTFVYIDGVYQQKNTYSTSGTTLTFSTAPPNGASVEVMSMTATTSIVGTVSDNAVTTAKIADNAVTTAKIASSQITVAKMAANSVDSDQYVDGSIDTVHIANSQITVGKMAVNSVDSDQYVDGSIDTVHIADDQVTGAKLANSVDVTTGLTVGGASNGVAITNGQIALKNSGTVSKLDFYCESNNAHYTRLQSAPHGSYAGNIVLTLPASDGDSGQSLTTNGSGVMAWATIGGEYNAWAIITTNTSLALKGQYICNDSSARTHTLPSGSAGSTITIKNNGSGLVTLARTSSQKINGVDANATMPEGNAVQLVYVDGTTGWLVL